MEHQRESYWGAGPGVAACAGKRVLFCNLVASSPRSALGVASSVITCVLVELLTHPAPPSSRGTGHFPLCLSFPTCKLGTLILKACAKVFGEANYLCVDVVAPGARGRGNVLIYWETAALRHRGRGVCCLRQRREMLLPVVFFPNKPLALERTAASAEAGLRCRGLVPGQLLREASLLSVRRRGSCAQGRGGRCLRLRGLTWALCKPPLAAGQGGLCSPATGALEC